MLPVFLASALVVVSVTLVFVGMALPPAADPIQTRLTTYAIRPRTLEEMEMEQPFYERVLKPIIMSISRLVGRYTPLATVEQIRHDLMVAGNPRGLQVMEFLGIKGAVAIAGAAGGFFFITLLGGSVVFQVFSLPIGAFLGFYLPNFWLKSKVTARQREIQLALPDVLDLLSVCVESGLGFDAAMQKVAQKWDNGLTREFERVMAEIGIGKTRREALRAMAERVDVPDLTSFAAAIIQADQLGVSISRILVLQAEQMRIKRRQRAEKAAHEAPIKMLIPMVLFMLPTIYIVILGPMIPKLASMFGGGGL